MSTRLNVLTGRIEGIGTQGVAGPLGASGVAGPSYVLSAAGAEVALATNDATPLLVQTIAGLLPSRKYLATIGVRVSIWQEGTEANCGEADCRQVVYITTDASAVATVTLQGTPYFDAQLAAALATTAFTLVASTGGFTISATRPAGVACAAEAQWWLAAKADGSVGWKDIT